MTEGLSQSNFKRAAYVNNGRPFLGAVGARFVQESRKNAGLNRPRALGRIQQTLHTLGESEELHRLLFEKVPYPRFVCDTRTLQILEVNEAAVRQYGYSRDELVRMRITDLSAPEGFADFEESVRKTWMRQVDRPGKHDHVFRHRKKDGRGIDVRIDTAAIPLQGRRLLLLLAEDVTERRRAEQRLRAQHATTQALSESSSVTEAVPAIFRAICESLGCDWGELWRVDMAVSALSCAQIWHPAAQPLPELERATRNVVLTRGEGIPGTVWLRNRPMWIPDLAEYPHFQRTRIMIRHGLRAGFAFPIGLNREVLGVIAVFRREVLPLDKHLLRMLRDICSQIGQMMGRRRAERRLLEISEREQQRIGQDLHDGICQQLTGIVYMASTMESSLAKKSLPEAKAAAQIARLSRETAEQARQVARGLNPVKVGKMGLMAALDELASSIQLMFSISCQFKCRRRVIVADHETAVHLYRIAQEAIHNAITHGKASRIVVSLERTTAGVLLSVKDNGRGLFKALRNGNGMGLENMNYRARAISARLEFKRCKPSGIAMNCEVVSREGRPA